MTGYEITLVCLALNVFKEARGEPLIGQQAVAMVTLNRAKVAGKDTCEIVFAPNQFSWTTTDAKNGVLLPGKHPDRKSPEWRQAVSVASWALTSQADFTKGSLYFHNTQAKPTWANIRLYTGKWGSHLFYK